MSTTPILNPDAIRALRDLSPKGDSEFLRELISIYLEDTPKQLIKLEQAIANQDAGQVVHAAHTIKGSSGNFGAAAFAHLAQEIEAHGKSQNLAAAAAALPELKNGFAQVTAALKQLAGS
jgi:HPt (histidine-containing phosphotransfer) domain-containing protein